MLEVGCNTGANLYLLAKTNPEAALYGIDINGHAVTRGQQWFRRSGMHQVRLSVSAVDSLSDFATQSVDVVLSDAVLTHVGPDKLPRALAEMRRVARRGLVLNEYAAREPPPDNYDGGRFVYNYWALFPGCVVEGERSDFQASGWDSYGWLFVVRFQ